MATSVAGISFDLSFDGSKMLASINASCKKVKDQFDKSFSQAAKKSTKAIETGNQEIDKILNNTARTAKSKAAAIASIYKKEGASSSEAFRKAWSLIERDSRNGSHQVKKHLKEIGDQSKKTSSEMGDDFSNGFASLKNSFSGGLSLIKKAGVMLAAAFGTKKLIDFSKQCLELGSDLAEVQNVVDVTFPNMTAQVDKFAKSAAQSFGLSETMAKQYTGTFGAMAKAFGFTEKQAYDMGSTLTGLAGDVASFYNLDQNEAYTKIKSVFTGETESLKDLGVVMTQTALDSYALANGFGKTTSKMSEAEKVALRYSFVQNQLSAATGDFARTSDSWANQVRIMKLQMQSFMATIGQGLINLFTPTIKMINTVIGKLATLANAFKSFTELITGNKSSSSAASPITDLSNTAGSATDDLQNASGAADNLSKSTNGVGTAAKKAAKEMKALMGFDKINKLDDNSSDSSTDSGSGTGNDGTAVGSAVDFGSLAKGTTVLDQVDSKASKTFKNLLKYITPTTKAMKKLWDEGLSRLGKFTWGSLKDFYNRFLVPVGKWTFGKGIPKFINALNEGLLKTDFNKIQSSLKRLWDALTPFSINIIGKGLLWFWENVLVPLGTWTANEVVPRFLDTLRIAIQGINGILTALQPLFQWFWDNVLQPIASWTGGVFLTIWDGVNDVLKKFADWCTQNPEVIQTIATIIASFFAAWKITEFVSAAGGFITTVVNIVGSIHSVAGALSLVETGIGTLVSALGGPFTIAIAAAIAVGVLLWKNWDTVCAKCAAMKDWVVKKTVTLKDGAVRAFTTLKTNIGNAMNAISNSISEKWNKAKTTFGNMLQYISGSFTQSWQKAWTGIKNIFQNVFSGLADLARTPINAIITAFNGVLGVINGVIEKVNGIKFQVNVPNWVPGIGGRGWGFNGFNIPSVGTIPMLAQGGYVKPNTPQLAMIGDNKHQGEVVAPEGKLLEMAKAAAEMSGGDTDKLLRELIKLIKDLPIVVLDPEALRKYFIKKTNQNTKAKGKSELIY